MSILLILVIIGLFFAVHFGKLAISRILTACLIVGIIIYIIISGSLLGALEIVITVGLLGLVFPNVFSIIGDLFHFLISI